MSRKLRFTALQGGVSGSAAEVTTNARVNIHRWSHIAVVRHKDKLEIYVNGVLDAKAAAGKPESNDKPLYVGSVRSSSAKRENIAFITLSRARNSITRSWNATIHFRARMHARIRILKSRFPLKNRYLGVATT